MKADTAGNLAAETRALEWSDLAVILAICRSESLSGAARTLGQNHSTVFRRINAIEKTTGVRFFERLPHGYVMTDAGQTAMRYAERVESEFHALGREILGRDMRLQGRIRLTCPEGLAGEIAPKIIAAFCRINPALSIDLAPGTGPADLSRREAEVAIRATPKPPETSFGRRVCDFRFALYSSRSYIDRNEALALPDHDWCLIDGIVVWLVPMIWKQQEHGERRTIFKSRASKAVLNATAEGMGTTLMPCYLADADDRLVRVSGTIVHLDMGLWILTHPDLRQTARVRALMAFLYEAFGAQKDLFEGKKAAGGQRLLI
jgi:DNA-binding transcriptional LysR family regulator